MKSGSPTPPARVEFYIRPRTNPAPRWNSLDEQVAAWRNGEIGYLYIDQFGKRTRRPARSVR